MFTPQILFFVIQNESVNLDLIAYNASLTLLN